MLQKIVSHVLIFVILVLTELSEVVVRAEQYLSYFNLLECVRYHMALTELSGRYPYSVRIQTLAHVSLKTVRCEYVRIQSTYSTNLCCEDIWAKVQTKT